MSDVVRELAPDVSTVIGGISWERRTLDPLAGPRAICELQGAEVVDRCAALASPRTVGPGNLVLSESRMSAFLKGERVALIDPGEGPLMAATGIIAVAHQTGCDAVILVDVGGDVLAQGQEVNLVSPLADAVMLATSPWLERAGLNVTAAIFGIGCDGELSPQVAREHISEVETLQGSCHAFTLRPERLPMLEQAASAVGSGTTALALRCARGQSGKIAINDGRQSALLTAAGAEIHLLEAMVAVSSVARLARIVVDAPSIEDAHRCLVDLGVKTTGLGYPGTTWTAPGGRRRARAGASRP